MTTTNNLSSQPSTEAAGGAAVSDPASPMAELFGKVISTYSRAQAIADGVLVDVSSVAPDVCKQHFLYPIACTATVWGIIDRAVKNERYCNDVNGIVHDILWMAKSSSAQVLDKQTRIFPVIITGADRQRVFRFKIVCGPGDNAEPVLTIMLPEED